jgi:putative heme-binding domain-containing protein
MAALLFAAVPFFTALAADAVNSTAAPVSARVPWTTSRVSGSPEPPSPFVTERLFPKLRFSEPIELVSLPGSDRLVLAEHAGKIVSFPNLPGVEKPDLFADMKQWKPEIQEVYSVAFHPDFTKNRQVYIWYILKPELPDGTRIARFKVTESDPPRVDLGTEEVVFTWKSGGHNGGCIRFGKDGMLYISTGDGVGPDPPDSFNTGQDIGDVLSSILRIDVNRAENGKPYAIPSDNPFVSTPGARPEVWAYGLRNPWRMSVDQKSGELWVCDVGWELWESVHRVQRGGNYGWSIMEGSRQVIKPDGKRGPTPILPPTYEHPHSEAASITGGFIYHGSRLRDLEGAYIYGDYQTGKIWALRHDGSRVTSHRELVDTPFQVVSFGEDRDGELIIVDFTGTLQRLVPNPAAGQPSTFPRRLSETGLFASLAGPAPAPGVVPYEVNAEQWQDGMIARRFVALPGSGSISTTNGWQFPKDAVLVRSLALPLDAGRPDAPARKVETQILHFDGDAWNAYAYRWNEAQTDAALVDASGAEETFTIRDASSPGGARRQTWRFSSRAECLRCHNSWCGFTLGFSAGQLDRSVAGHPQLAALAESGVLNRAPGSNPATALANPPDASGDLNARARAWLHTNCSHCHREHAGGSVLSFMNHDSPLEKLNLVGARPMQGAFGIPGAEVVAPGDPYRSILYYRVSKLGKGHMPYLGSHVIDERGVALIHDWITSLPHGPLPEAVAKERGEQDAALAAFLAAGTAGERTAAAGQLLKTIGGALKLVRALGQPALAKGTRDAVAALGAASSDRQIADLFERFVPEEQRVKTLGPDIKPESILSLQGDVERGRRLFFQPVGAQCNTCHRAGGEGRDLGPDLSQIAKKYTRGQILENILQPSKVIDPKFVAYVVETKDGESHTGFLLSRDSRQLVLKDAAGAEVKLAMSDVSKVEAQKLSLMPEGLLQTLTAQEAADLLEFLASMR